MEKWRRLKVKKKRISKETGQKTRIRMRRRKVKSWKRKRKSKVRIACFFLLS